MTDQTILNIVAELNPVTTERDDDVEAGERQLARLLANIHADRRRVLARPAGRPRPRLVLVSAAAVAAAVTLLATGTRSVTQPGGMPNIKLTAHLVALRTSEALASAQQYIVRSVQTQVASQGTYVSHRWEDQLQTLNSRDEEYLSGGPLALNSVTYLAHGVLSEVQVDYRHRMFTRVESRPPRQAPPSYAQVTRKDLASGWDSPVGRARRGGRAVLVLVDQEPGMHRQLWVDASTYLPVRMTAHWNGGSYLINYTWIRRTPQSLKTTFTAPVPARFAQVAQLPGD